MSFKIRPMMEDDLCAVEVIQAEAYAGYFLESADVIAKRFELSPTTAWVAERDGDVCAYLVSYWSNIGKINPLNAPFSPVENANCLYLHDLALLKAAQGFGVGRRLIQVATEHALKNAAEAIALLSVQNSKAFWRGFGFREFLDLDMQQQQHLETYVDGSLDTAFYMVKLFKSHGIPL
jgi:GNAT superfamily N-acetyltransferase